MSEQGSKVRRQATVVVEDMDAAMGAPGGGAVASDGPPVKPATDRVGGLNRSINTWTSPYASPGVTPVTVRFTRAPGGTLETIARVLGPEGSQNRPLLREFAALASIIEVNGERVSQPRTMLTFQGLKRRVGFVGPKDEDWFDEAIAAFVFAFECAMYPETLRTVADLEGSGLSAEDEARILKSAGLQPAKLKD